MKHETNLCFFYHKEKIFFGRTQEVKTMKKWTNKLDYIKIWSFCFSKSVWKGKPQTGRKKPWNVFVRKLASGYVKNTYNPIRRRTTYPQPGGHFTEEDPPVRDQCAGRDAQHLSPANWTIVTPTTTPWTVKNLNAHKACGGEDVEQRQLPLLVVTTWNG